MGENWMVSEHKQVEFPKFEDTSEYVYLSVLCSMQDCLIEMIRNGEFSESQLKKLVPVVDCANEILNANRGSLNKDTLEMVKKSY